MKICVLIVGGRNMTPKTCQCWICKQLFANTITTLQGDDADNILFTVCVHIYI